MKSQVLSSDLSLRKPTDLSSLMIILIRFIPYNHDAEKTYSGSRFANSTKNSMRKLSNTVSIYENEYNSLLGVGALEDVNGLFMLQK